MAKIVITRPNGETEYAALTTDKAQAGNDRLSVENAGAVYYAKLDSGVSTHMYIIKPDGRRLYVQKEFKFVWKYDLTKDIDKMIIPKTGMYRLNYTREVEPLSQNKYYTTTNHDIILKKGTMFVKEKGNIWCITDAEECEYRNLEHWDNLKDKNDPSYEKYTDTLISIEYIGEA